MNPVRVFLVDDSALSRVALRRALEADSTAEVVGEATDGRQALDFIPSSRAQIVLMDIMMSPMDGLTATQELMRCFPVPVLIVSDLVERGSELNFKALQAGALDVLRKPSAAELEDQAALGRLRRKVRLLAGVPVITRRAPRAAGEFKAALTSLPHSRTDRLSLLCIGASTGGPPAILKILKRLAPAPPWPIVLVQHMSRGFTAGMVRWMASSAGLEVVCAAHKSELRPGVVYVADEDRHLIVRNGRLLLSDAAPVGGHRPSVDMLFESIAETGGAGGVVAVLLTGMGSDGARGLRRIRDAGGWTIAQDQTSSVVFGMPKAAVELDGACEVLNIETICDRLHRLGELARCRPSDGASIPPQR